MFQTALFLHCEFFAYLDPNAGGWLFQLLFPLLVALSGLWMVLRKKAAALCRRIFGREDKNPGDRK